MSPEAASPLSQPRRFGSSAGQPLTRDSVRYANQPIALVMAETLEAATEGAALLRPQFDAQRYRQLNESRTLAGVSGGHVDCL